MVVIFIFKAVDASLSMKWKPGLIPRLFKSSVKSVKARIISLSLLLLIYVVSMKLPTYTYMTWVYLFPLLDVVGKLTHISELTFPSFIMIGSTVVQHTTSVLIFSSRSISGSFSLVYFSPCLILCRYHIVVSLIFNMPLDKFFCEAWPCLQETFFYCLDED